MCFPPTDVLSGNLEQSCILLGIISTPMSSHRAVRPLNHSAMHFSRVFLMSKKSNESDWIARLLYGMSCINSWFQKLFLTAWKLFSCFMSKSSFDRETSLFYIMFFHSFFISYSGPRFVSLSLHWLIRVSERQFNGLVSAINVTWLSNNKLDSKEYFFLTRRYEVEWNKSKWCFVVFVFHKSHFLLC